MPELYPSNIPQKFQERGFEYTVGNNLIRSEFSSGPSQTRRKSTKRIDTMKGVIRFTKDELQVFETWYNSTIKDGSLSFYITNPMNQQTIEVKFKNQYKYVPIGFDTYDVNFELEVI